MRTSRETMSQDSSTRTIRRFENVVGYPKVVEDQSRIKAWDTYTNDTDLGTFRQVLWFLLRTYREILRLEFTVTRWVDVFEAGDGVEFALLMETSWKLGYDVSNLFSGVRAEEVNHINFIFTNHVSCKASTRAKFCLSGRPLELCFDCLSVILRELDFGWGGGNPSGWVESLYVSKDWPRQISPLH